MRALDPAADDDAPGLDPRLLEAFEAWRRAHPPAPSMASTEHAEWMRFSAARLLAAACTEIA